MNASTTAHLTASLPPASDDAKAATVGLIGARGHTGAELLRLIDTHPRLRLAFASSRTMCGRPIQEVAPEVSTTDRFIDVSSEMVGNHEADLYVLALPNELSQSFVDAIDAKHDSAVIVDLSADHRFDDTWAYGLPELNADCIRKARRIANPGCYATAMILVLRPLREMLDGPPSVFGVSGYSGAGTTPSPRNDPARLHDNIIPYQLTGHIHEREVSHQLGVPVRFAPHVAPFFRGITVTASMRLIKATTETSLGDLYREFYANEPLVRVMTDDTPLVRDAVDHIHATVGQFTVDESEPRHVAAVATLDNLLKGAASQAIQNINLAFGFAPLEGLV